MEVISQHVLYCVLSHLGHGGDFSACILYVEPFGHGGDLSAFVLCVARAIWGMEAISRHVY